MVWYGMLGAWHGRGMVLYGMVGTGIWYGMAWHGRGMARYGRGMVWLGMVGL